MAYQAEYIWIDGTVPTPLLRSKTKVLADDWTAVTRDKSLSAQFEHSVGVTATGDSGVGTGWGWGSAGGGGGRHLTAPGGVPVSPALRTSPCCG